jgi:succinate dehydrogenase/fumarate reductase flavoprotein subunit
MSAQLDRRDFLKGAALAGAAAATTSLIGCGTSESSSNTTAETKYFTADNVLDTQWQFEIPPTPIDDSQITETIEADIIIIGAGVSGLVCAASAVESGANVHLFAASKAPVTRGGSNNGINTKAQQRLGIEYTPESIKSRIKQELAHNGGRVDASKWWRWINNSHIAMDWAISLMENAGYETTLEVAYQDADGAYTQIPASHNWIGGDVTFGAFMGESLLASQLESKITSDGGMIDYQVVAQYLLKDSSRVTGVVAQKADGSYVKYMGSTAVVMATGDFSQNRDMMTKYCPEVLDLLSFPEVNYDAQFAFGGLFPGDGQKMGLWAGAAWQKVYPNAPMIDMLGPAPYNQSIGNHCGINLNKNGERFMNEDTLCSYGAYFAMQQPEKTVYTVWDTAYASFYPEWESFGCTLASDNGPKPSSPAKTLTTWQASATSGTFVTGDTIDAVLKQLDGLDIESAAESIRVYNGYVDAGMDDQYHKNVAHLAPIKTGPFFGCKTTVNSSANFLCVTGGLRTSKYMEVCDENDSPIPGLYNIGVMVGDTYANIYTFSICGQNLGMNCITFGYLLGKQLATGKVME